MVDGETSQSPRDDAFAGGSDAFGSGAPLESSPIGAYLRRQRLLREISIEELSDLTRIPLRSLSRLESGEFDGETDGFVRGFVRTVATALGLDPDDTISRMLEEPGASAWERHASGRRLKQGLAIGAFGLALAALLLVLEAGWSLVAGAPPHDPSADAMVWRDPVRALAEAAGAEVDPAGEIGPRRLSPPIVRESPAATNDDEARARRSAMDPSGT